MKKALIIGTYHDAPYHPFEGVDAILKELLRDEFEVTLTDQLSALVTIREKGYDLVISYLDDFDKIFPPECAESVLDFVKGGGGLLCLHNGLSIQTDDRMFSLTGGKFLRHPPQTELTFEPTPEGILSDLPGFSFPEEPYQFGLSGGTITPLLTYQYNGLSCLGGWSREEGSGKIVFLTPGHSADIFRKKEYQNMIRRSAMWVCGLTTDG